MSLPKSVKVEDIAAVCEYLATKPTGATLADAKTVLDAKYLRARKLSAMKDWGFISEDEGRLLITDLGRAVIREGSTQNALRNVIKNQPQYNAIIERAAHQGAESWTATEVGAHWFQHFKSDVSSSERYLHEQAVCFFHIAEGAGLGTIIVGRKGSPTRFEFNREGLSEVIQTPGGQPEQGEVDLQAEQEPHHEDGVPLVDRLEGDTLGQGIFIAHGKNKKPLEQLKNILGEFEIPYKIAVDEPNLGRPIGTKVKEIMQSCNCAILIFTADEEFSDQDGNPVLRPSENVVYELGAAGYLYEDRIVILKEEGIEFATNFQDLGYIAFEKDQLENKAMDVIKELIGFKIVKVST